MRRPRDFSLATQGVVVVTLPVAALLLAMVVFYQFERQSRGASRAVEHSLETRAELRGVLTQMVNAETGIRGYLLTRRATFLEPYDAAVRQLPQSRENLRRLATDVPGASARLSRVEELTSQLLAAMERSRRAVANGNEHRALAELEPDKAAMDALRVELDALIEEAQRQLTLRTEEANRVEWRTHMAIFTGGGLGLLGGLIAAVVFTKRIAQRMRGLEGEARDVAEGRPIAREVRGHDEIARLERTLQETSGLLNRRAEELRRAHSELEARVEARTAELRAANEELRLSNEVRQAVIQSSPLAIWAVDLEGRVTFWNPAAERIFGFTEAETIGKPLPVIPEDLMAEYREWLARFAKGQAWSGVERRRRRKDGTEIHVMIWTAPLRDREGRIRGAIALDSDISQQKLLEEQFRQSQKMEAVGRLAGGVAHDFNNLLTVIQGYTEMAASEAAEKAPQVLEYTREIEYASGRAAALTAQLLAFSRRQISQPKILDLNEVVTHSLKLLRRVIGEDVEVVTRLDPNLGPVNVDPIHIDQVIMNLVVNARDAMRAGGRLTIETRNQELDAEYAGRHLGVTPGRYSMLAISDTGSGMTPEVRSRLFEPFFTTKEAGKGTGLGLSIVYGIVKQNHGEIMVYSEPGKGTTFKIYLPVAEGREEAPAARGGERALRGSETILVCEDEVKIRELVERMLTKQGYRVLGADTPAEALRMARESVEEIDVLLTDVVMPRMSGFELARAVAAVRPGMKMIYMSGYTDNHMMQGVELGPETPFLQKPFTAAALGEMVRRVLEAPGGGVTSPGGLP